ncbi:UNVERIFIED_CONTAM: hypothetical protein GTU68_031355 [Idotea baltica]|nr:hypothetical protein [Idotea baltica]
MKYKWKEIARELQAMSQIGLTYTKDKFDVERYERLREISVEIMSNFTDTDMEIVRGIFANETGYQTPKVDVRAVVFKDGKLLLVQERDNDLWALPGGWADVGLSPSENAVKEVREESGLEVKPLRLLALWDKKFHNHPYEPHYCYKIAIRCELIGGTLKPSIETHAAAFFSQENIPPLSTNRNTAQQVNWLFEQMDKNDAEVVFD